MTRPREYDVVVLGGGPAGCAAAIALRQHEVDRVLVVEAGRYEADRIGEGIPPDTRILLQRLGVWNEFLKEGHDACLGSCSSWGTAELGYNDFLFNPLGNGWHLERKRFDSFLAESARRKGVELSTGTRFEVCEPIDDGYRLRLVSDDGTGSTVVARFVIDATGMRSAFARRQGAKRLFLDQLICVCGFLDVAASAEFSRLTMLEAVDYGWWYAARLPNARVAVAVASDAELIKDAGLRGPDKWLAGLARTNHIASRLSNYRFVAGSLLACPAPSFLLDKTVGERWLAVGDAASAFDPIAAQGIYKSLSDGLEAAESTVAFLAGDATRLLAYQSAVSTRFETYVDMRNYFYGLEQRWPASRFWRRRQQRTAQMKDARAFG